MREQVLLIYCMPVNANTSRCCMYATFRGKNNSYCLYIVPRSLRLYILPKDLQIEIY